MAFPCLRLKSRIAFNSEDRFLESTSDIQKKQISIGADSGWMESKEWAGFGVGSLEQMFFFSLFGWRGTTAVIKVHPS